MGTARKKTATQPTRDVDAVATTNVKEVDAATQAEGAAPLPEVVTLEGIKLEGILKEMQIAYQCKEPRGKSWPPSVRRWRRLYMTKPDTFMSILEKQELKFEARLKDAKSRRTELERLKGVEAKLGADLTAALGRVAELEGELSRLLPEVAGESLSGERLEELETRLLREAKA